MNDNYYSDASKELVQKLKNELKNLFEASLKKVLAILDYRKLEKSRDNVALVLAELMVKDETIDDRYIAVFGHVLKQILEYLGIQKSRLFFNNDEKNLTEIRNLLVDKIKEYKEKKSEKRLQKEKRISEFKLKLLNLDFDYLKALIEKVGLQHFAALSLLAKLPKLEEKLEQDDIGVFISDVKIKLDEIEENVWKNQEGLFPIKNALESLLFIADELSRLQQLLEKKGIILSYSDLVNLLKIKYAEISDEKINPSKENLYNSFKKMTFILFEKAKLKKTKEDITSAFITAVSVIRKNNSESVNLVLNAFPNLLNEFLNKLLKEFNIIKNDLPQDEVKDLLNRKTNEVEIDIFEAELKRGAKTRMDIPENLDTFSGSDFESFLEKLFRKLGYSVIKTPLTGDQGADLVVEKSGEKIVVQAKRYCGVVSNKAVQEAVAAISYYKCNRAIVITTSSFTKSALKLAYLNKVELWDGKKLREIINNLKDSMTINDSLTGDGEIEGLLPENYRKSSQLKKLLTVRPQKGINIQKIKTQCVFCEEEIEFSVDLRKVVTKEEVSFKTECPHCGNTMTVNPKVATWRCKYCPKEFETKIEAEKHEKVCLKRKK